jgi:hypothetical protein
MKMGQEHSKDHLFEHVDALLVSGFCWDSISICVEEEEEEEEGQGVKNTIRF